MRIVLLIAFAALPALAQRDAGMVWGGLRRGWSASNAVHNTAQPAIAGNTRGPIQALDNGIASNGAPSAAWVGLGTNVYPLLAASEATLSVWVKLASPTLGSLPLIGNDPSSGATGTVGWAIQSATHISCYWHGTKFTNYVYYDKTGLPTVHRTNWVHLATTWRSATTNVQLFIDGRSMTVTPARVGVNVTDLPPCNTEWRLGAFSNGGAQLLNGNAMWMGAIYSRALSTNEVMALYMRERKDIPQ